MADAASRLMWRNGTEKAVVSPLLLLYFPAQPASGRDRFSEAKSPVAFRWGTSERTAGAPVILASPERIEAVRSAAAASARGDALTARLRIGKKYGVQQLSWFCKCPFKIWSYCTGHIINKA